MSSIFVCYSHADESWLTRLQVHLKPLVRDGQIEYWDDTKIIPGEKWRQEIRAAIERATIAVLLVSSDFYASDFIAKNELPPLLQAAEKRGVRVFGIHTGRSRFTRDTHLSEIQTINDPKAPLEGLTKDEQEKVFDELVGYIEQALPKSEQKTSLGSTSSPYESSTSSQRHGMDRATSLRCGELALPCFFRSVSSHETQLAPDAALKVLRAMNAPAVLISAYDLAKDPGRSQIASETRRLRENGCIIILDSGNYEAVRKQVTGSYVSRKNDIESPPPRRHANWRVDEYRKILRQDLFDYAFCYDKNHKTTDPKILAREVIKQVKRDSKFVKDSTEILPILHAPGDSDNGYDQGIIPSAALIIAEELHPKIIAIPERELGDGIWDRVKTVRDIRRELEKLDFYQPIHLLGTGNFMSIALFSAVGADFFDGLEWCRTVVDPSTSFLHHHQHYDFFADKPITTSATERFELSVPYHARMAIHNIEFIDHWMKRIQEARKQEAMGRLLLDVFQPLPDRAVQELISTVPELFQ